MTDDMKIKKKAIKKKAIFIGFALILVIVYFIGFSFSGFSAGIGKSGKEELEVKFAVLSGANSNSCGGTFSFVDAKSDEERIQGSCCGPMNFHRYSEQIAGLKKYSKFEKIPSDPYDVPVSSARELLGYQKTIVLTSEQQIIYDQAVSLSHEGGPCCCKCWHWYAYEGLAKYLITKEGFSAEQVAEVWDLSDACGGDGHVEGAH